MSTVALVSYNGFVGGESNGWKEQGGNRVLLLQNSGGESWGAKQGPQSQSELVEGANSVSRQIGGLWGVLVDALPELDMVYFYVGSTGAEKAIELAKRHRLDPGKATFVLCDCGYSGKMRLIEECGFSSSRVIMCACGGHSTMRRLYDDALATVSP
ncbi:MAG: hypothetical protein WCJ25_01290 [Candidatus Moraniibacteriota bacterium]